MKISDETRKQYINEIMRYFQKELNEKIGIIFAESLLDFFIQTIGDEIYNRGVNDSKRIILNNSEDLEINIESLLRR